MECFYFATGVAPEPSLEACREVVAKTFALIVLLDDIDDRPVRLILSARIYSIFLS